MRRLQQGSPDAFYPHAFTLGLTPWPPDLYIPATNSNTVNGVYVDGVSITLSDPHKHIWTYAAGLSDDFQIYEYANCPCARHSALETPVFVGDNYYCESGNINWDI